VEKPLKKMQRKPWLLPWHHGHDFMGKAGSSCSID
jgi:hypothetical protein